jgi:hypothetical protein
VQHDVSLGAQLAHQVFIGRGPNANCRTTERGPPVDGRDHVDGEIGPIAVGSGGGLAK